MSVKEYSLKFVKLSKYAPSLVTSSRDEMSRFVNSVTEDMEEECRAAMLHDNMDLAILMVHAHQVEESRQRKRGREAKKPSSSDQAGSSPGRSSFEFQDRSKFKKGNDRNAQRDAW